MQKSAHDERVKMGVEISMSGKVIVILYRKTN